MKTKLQNAKDARHSIGTVKFAIEAVARNLSVLAPASDRARSILAGSLEHLDEVIEFLNQEESGKTKRTDSTLTGDPR